MTKPPRGEFECNPDYSPIIKGSPFPLYCPLNRGTFAVSNEMQDNYSRIDESYLDELLDLATSATPRPWYVRRLDDDHASNLIAISTTKDTHKHERWPHFGAGEIVAATIVQNPRYVCIADEKWSENAEYIVAAATVLPTLIQEVIRLRKQVESAG